MATHPIDRKNGPEPAAAAEDVSWRIGPSVSSEARAVLEEALAAQTQISLNEALAAMPNVGLDSDFDRHHQG
jgi:plasmid stability protein